MRFGIVLLCVFLLRLRASRVFVPSSHSLCQGEDLLGREVYLKGRWLCEMLVANKERGRTRTAKLYLN